MNEYDLLLRWFSSRSDGTASVALVTEACRAMAQRATFAQDREQHSSWPGRFIDTLHRLGHVERFKDKWAVVPPTVLWRTEKHQQGEAHVYGARSQALQERLQHEGGSRFIVVPQSDGPALWKILGTRAEAAAVAHSLQSEFYEERGDVFLEALPSLAETVQHLRDAWSLPTHGAWEFFQVARSAARHVHWNWVPVVSGQSLLQGVYRTTRNPRVWVYVSPAPQTATMRAYRLDPSNPDSTFVARWRELARNGGLSLCYDSTARTLTVPAVGVSLPVLVDRALRLASGRCPIGMIEPGVEEDFDGDFDWAPRATAARLGTDRLQPFRALPGTNVAYLQQEDRLLSLNSNEGEGFGFRKLKGEEIWVVPDALKGRWKSAVPTEPSAEITVGLAAGKHTDILLLRLGTCPATLNLDMASPQRLYTRAAYYSWGYLLRKAACDFLDVEPAELDVNLRPVTTERGAVGEIVLFDSLENGAGYCRYLQEKCAEALLRPLLPGGRLYEQLMQDTHTRACDGSCYDCLRDYHNTDLHPLLDWRLGLDLARLAMDGQAQIDLRAAYWEIPVQRAVMSLARVIGQKTDIKVIEDHRVLYVDSQVRAVLTHPLWSSQHPQWLGLASHLQCEASTLPCCTLFDALRRPGWCVSQLRPATRTLL